MNQLSPNRLSTFVATVQLPPWSVLVSRTTLLKSRCRRAWVGRPSGAAPLATRLRLR